MGYCYDMSGKLCCDSCGQSGGVRRRTCPYYVSGDSHRSQARYRMPYCSPPAYCASCFKARGGMRAIHAECASGAVASQAKYDAKQTRLDAGEHLVISALMCEDRNWTSVTFAANHYEDHITVEVPSEHYSPTDRPALSDYPVTRDSAGHITYGALESV